MNKRFGSSRKSSPVSRHAHSLPGAVEHANSIPRAVEHSTGFVKHGYENSNAWLNVDTGSSSFLDPKDLRWQIVLSRLLQVMMSPEITEKLMEKVLAKLLHVMKGNSESDIKKMKNCMSK